jgi:hypothetical protein
VSATVREVPAWELSRIVQSEPDGQLIDRFFRVYQPHYSREGSRHVITIPPTRTGEYPESWISQPDQSLTDFLIAVTFVRQPARAHITVPQERAA